MTKAFPFGAEMNFAARPDTQVLRPEGNGSRCDACQLVECRFRGYAPQKDAIRQRVLTRGETLECREGVCLRFWVIVSGHAATCTSFRDGRRQILSIEGEGDTICGSMATRESEQRLEALTDCQICDIDLSRWSSELRENPTFLAMSARLLHARLVKSLAHVSTLGRLDSNERVTYFLAETALRRGDTGGLTTLPMSREDIADYLGLNTDSVSRILSRIRKSGLFRFISATEYTVPSMEAVARRLPVALPDPTEPIYSAGGHAS